MESQNPQLENNPPTNEDQGNPPTNDKQRDPLSHEQEENLERQEKNPQRQEKNSQRQEERVEHDEGQNHNVELLEKLASLRRLSSIFRGGYCMCRSLGESLDVMNQIPK